jgi:REP element-mobilizing transposase RayT
MILHCRSHGSRNPGDFPGAWYHVLNRGIERLAIFRSTRCCEKFIELLSSLPERFGVRLHGYALMGNHYHLQLESREANLSKALHWLNVSYSVWFNRKYSRVGPTVSGTFQSHPPRANRSAEDQPLHSFESGTDCRLGRTRDSRRRRTRDNSAIGAASRWILWNNTIGVPTLSSLEPEQHPPGYAPRPSWRSSVQARNASSKRRFVKCCGKRQPSDVGRRTGRPKLNILSSSVARNLWLRCASFSAATEINRQESGEQRLKP